MSDPSAPFLVWPGGRHLRLAALVSLVGGLWFVLVYSGCDAITAHRDARVRIHFDWETKIPFVPDAVLVYMSIYPLFFAAPFVLRQRQEFLALAVTLNTVILAGGLGFLLLPAQLAFPPSDELGLFPHLFRFADRLNLTYNLVPSLHVALSVACIGAFVSKTGQAGRILLWSWSAAIAASTLLTHQHHLVDVVSGGGLGWAMSRFVFPLLQRARFMSLHPPESCENAAAVTRARRR